MRGHRALVGGVLCLSLFLTQAVSLRAADEKDDDGLVQTVITLLGDKDKDMRAMGLDQVRTEVKGSAATKQFSALLPKLSPDAQVGLLSALADRGDAGARFAVLETLATPADEAVKVAAIEALGALGGKADVERLAPLLTSPEKAERTAARKSLVRLPGEGVPAAIVAEMYKSSSDAHVTLIEILATRRALGTIRNIMADALDDDPKVRAAAMTALGQLAGPDDIPGMVRGVLRADTAAERVAAEKNLMFVCNRIEDPERRAEPLLAAMDQIDPEDRIVMLPALGRVGGAEALPIIEKAIAATDPDRHAHGIYALCNWPNASVAPRLIELAKANKHPEDQAAALAALIRIAPLPDKRSADERLELVRKTMSLCTRDSERNLLLKRASAVRTLDMLHFVLPYLDQPAYAQQACETVVELAHHRELREPNKSEFDPALDKVIRTSKNETVIERANRYKKGQTWAKPRTAE